MEYNDTTNEICPVHGVKEVREAKAESVTVSAALRMNVHLKATPNESVDGSTKAYDFSLGNDKAINKDKGVVTGRIQGYGVTVQLMNANGQGMKGVELPTGPISVTLDMRNTYKTETPVTTINEPNGYEPLLWSYGGNDGNNVQSDGRHVGGIGMAIYAPFNRGANQVACYNGGNWTASQQNGSKVTFTITDYRIDMSSFPYAYTGAWDKPYYYDPATVGTNPISVGCFSAGEIYILQPVNNVKTGKYIWEEHGSGTFTLTVEEGDLTAVSKTGQSPQGIGNVDTNVNVSNKNQQKVDENNDRQVKTVYLTVPGEFDNYVMYTYYGNPGGKHMDVNNSIECRENGKDAAMVQGKLGIMGGFRYVSGNESQNQMMAANSLLKFDGNALEIMDGIVKLNTRTYDMESKALFGALPSGENWESDDQLKATKEDGLIWYSSIEELNNSGAKCVAVLLERRGASTGSDQAQYPYFNLDVKVRGDESLSGNVYMLYESSRLWTRQDISSKLAEDPNYVVPSAIDTTDYDDGNPLTANAYPKSKVNFNPPYTKAEYNYNGYVSGHTGSYNRGDSLYVVRYFSQVEKTVEQMITLSGTNYPKKTYQLDYSERIADYVISPSIRMEEIQGTIAPGDKKTTVKITDVLPKNLYYVPGSATFGGTYTQNPVAGRQGTVTGGTQIEPIVSTGPNGTTILLWVIEDVLIQDGPLDKLHYSCLIGNQGDPENDVKNNDELENSVVISTTEDHREKTLVNKNLSKTAIKVSQTSQLALSKVPVKKFFELKEDIGYKVNYSNNSQKPTNIMILDSMPYTGDPWGSNYSGGYKIAKWKLDIDKLGGPANTMVLYYTEDPQYKGKVVNEIGEDVVRTWPTLPIEADGTVQWGDIVPTAWALEGTINGGKSIQVNVILGQQSQEPGDILCNNISQGNNNVYGSAYIVKRYIDGCTWNDYNKDGIRQSSEPFLPGVQVTLKNTSDGTVVKNGKGAICQMTTDQNGYYSFSALPAGDFYVEFSSGETDLSKWYSSPAKVEDGTGYTNSDYVATLDSNGNVEVGKIEGINMPSTDKMLSSVYFMKHLDGGFYQMGNLSLAKEVTGSGDEQKDWNFVVRLLREDVELDGEFQYTGSKSGTIKSGDTVTLKHGQQVTIKGIPAGVNFQVVEVEANLDGYTTGQVGNEGKIMANQTSIALFINNILPPEPTKPEPDVPDVPEITSGEPSNEEPAITDPTSATPDKETPTQGKGLFITKTGDPGIQGVYTAIMLIVMTILVGAMVTRKKD